MNKNVPYHSIKSIKIDKIANLTNSDIIINSSNKKVSNSEKHNSFHIDKNKISIFPSFNSEIKLEKISKRKKTVNFNINNNKTSNNFLFMKRKNNYSKTENFRKVKKIILDENEKKKTNNIEQKEIKNLKIYSSSKSINPKEILIKDGNNTLIKLDSSKNNVFKNSYYIKTAYNLGNETSLFN